MIALALNFGKAIVLITCLGSFATGTTLGLAIIFGSL